MTRPKTKLNVLLVDDSEDDAYFFGRTLQKSGLQCVFHHLPGGAEAIDYLREAEARAELPDVMFLDLKMPVVNGFEVLEWMRTGTSRPQLRVIVLSGSDQQNDMDRARSLGASDYLVKPLKVSDLDFLREVCSRNPQKGVRV
jgi:CheY-like chemotaxis protein